MSEERVLDTPGIVREPKGAASSSATGRPERVERRRTTWSVLAFRYSGVMGIGLLILVYSLMLPGVFFTEVTLRTIIANQAITGIIALGALVALTAGMIDLSVGAVAGLAMVYTVWASVNTDMSTWIICAIAVLLATSCGAINALLVTLIDLDSLIVTLGMSSLVLGVSLKITEGATLYGEFDQRFVDLGQGAIGPIPNLTIVLVALALAVWVWLEHTPGGRYTQAVGSNPVAAKLAGISVFRTCALSLLASSAVAGIGGVMLAAQVGQGATSTGPAYLLPVFAAIFLGATQVKDRSNVVGTMIAVLLIGTGIKGLQLSGATAWATDAFNGAVLLLAVTVAAVRRRRAAVGK